MTMRIKVTEFSMDADVKAFKKAIRPAAQAAAQVFYDRVKSNVRAIGRVTGNLERSIYQAYSKDNSADGKRATYHVSWRTKGQATLNAEGRVVGVSRADTAPHGHLVEYGHVQKYVQYVRKDGKWVTDKSRPLKTPRHVAARPFIRPANAVAPQAFAAAEAVLDKVFA